MNIKQAKERFTLEGLLSSLGHEPDHKKSKSHDLWYCSPFRPDEKEPSFHIDTRNGFFKDFGQSEKGGDLIDFVKLYLKCRGLAYEITNVLQWLTELDGGYAPRTIKTKVQAQTPANPITKEDPYKILSVKEIFSPTLLTYLDQRGIAHDIARRYLVQVYYQRSDTGKKMYGLGGKMRGGGYDVRNTFGFKTTIGKKNITRIKGTVCNSSVDIYEGVIDFLTRLTLEQNPKPDCDSIILNSTSLCEKTCDYIKDHHYSKITLWHDNDKAGQQFEAAFAAQFIDYNIHPVSLEAMNHVFYGYKDLNEWHMNSNLTLEAKAQLLQTPPRFIPSGEESLTA